MSRVGKQPIVIPSGVSVTIEPDTITVTGSKGTLSQFTMPDITVTQHDGTLSVTRTSDDPKIRAKHGLMRSLIHNMIVGVSTGFSKKLELTGVGYRVNMNGTDLKFNIGFSHAVDYHIPTGITASTEQNVMTISGVDKQQVGQVAAEIRKLKKPEPYKGKGIAYVGERIIRKSGKSGKEK